jgi:hypothetical protein
MIRNTQNSLRRIELRISLHFAELIGLKGIYVDRADSVGSAWNEASNRIGRCA